MNAKLTAYALNELPPDERAALEAEMETNPALRAEAEEMRKFCTVLHDEVSSADKVALTVEQRVRVLREFTADVQPKKATRSIWRHPAFLVPTAIAACTTFMLVMNLNRPPASKEMEQMLERRLAERAPARPASENVRVTMSEKLARPETQTPAPGKPEMPALVAVNSGTALTRGATDLPPIPAPVIANNGALVLPKSMEGTSTTFSGDVTNSLFAANQPVAPQLTADNGYTSATGLAGKAPDATRGFAIGTARPLERFSFTPETLGEVPVEMRIAGAPTSNVDLNGTTSEFDLWKESVTLPSYQPAATGASSVGGAELAFNDSASIESSLGITSGGRMLNGANTYTGGVTISSGTVTTATIGSTDNQMIAVNGNVSGNGKLQTDAEVPVLAEIPIVGQTFKTTGGVVKSGSGYLALDSSAEVPRPIAAPAGTEPIAPGQVIGIFGGGMLPESGKNEPLAATGNTSLSMSSTNSIGNKSSVMDGADRRGTVITNSLSGSGATTAPTNNFALADTAKTAPKLKVTAGSQLNVPMDSPSGSTTPTAPATAPAAQPSAVMAQRSAAATVAFSKSVPEAAGAAPATPAAPAPTPMLAATAAPVPSIAAATPAPAMPFYKDLNEPEARVTRESLVRKAQESEVEEVSRAKEVQQLGDLEDKMGRSRTLPTRRAGGETYTPIYENPFLQVAQQPLSTFSIDVDTASYANVRRFLNNGQRPPADAVRLEELINYFPYSYEPPAEDGAPFSVTVDMAEAPWQPMHRLARIALKGREIRKERGAANFVFLVDVSGSMDEPDKLPLVKQSLRMLTEQIKDTDRVALVTYAGESGVALESTPGSERKKIQHAIEKLGAGGSTNGAGGIRMAYQQAAENFVQEGVNRVILCTDGDFNVGLSSPEELEKLIADKAKSRVFLSVLGYGTGNLKDRTMETLADKGNGNYAYIDSLSEARKVLVDQMNATLVTIAKDVKIQVEFNPTQVAAYRLLGYENRALAKEDFNNDRKDAGEIGAGHTVTALYEIVPAGARMTSPDGRPMVDNLKYAPKPVDPSEPAAGGAPPSSKETMTVKLRYKQPEGDKSQLIEVPVTDKEQTMANAPRDFVFAASVTGFGMLLRNSQYSSELTWDMVRDMAIRGKGEDALGYRGEFLQLIDKARGLTEGRE